MSLVSFFTAAEDPDQEADPAPATDLTTQLIAINAGFEGAHALLSGEDTLSGSASCPGIKAFKLILDRRALHPLEDPEDFTPAAMFAPAVDVGASEDGQATRDAYAAAFLLCGTAIDDFLPGTEDFFDAKELILSQLQDLKIAADALPDLSVTYTDSLDATENARNLDPSPSKDIRFERFERLSLGFKAVERAIRDQADLDGSNAEINTYLLNSLEPLLRRCERLIISTGEVPAAR